MPPLIHTFELHDKHYAFDANSNTILPLDEKQWPLVKLIEEGEVAGEARELLDLYQEQGYFREPELREIEHPETGAMRYHLARRLQRLTLQVTQDCNLRCDYCSYSGTFRTRSHSKKVMSFETARKAIDYVLSNSIDEERLSIGFYGGEPLLEVGLIKSIPVFKRK